MEIVLIGDFNINFANNQDPNRNKIPTILGDLGLRKIIKSPTRVTNTSRSTIDLIFTNIGKVLLHGSGVINVSVSDHMPIFMSRKAGPHKHPKKIVNRRNYRLYI